MKNRFELIERYLDNELNKEERKQVLALMAIDNEFVKEYHLHLEVNKAIVEKDVLHLRNSLKEIFHNSKQDTGTTIRKLYKQKWHLAAASATILVIIGSMLFSNINTSQKGELFNQYFEAETSIMVTRSTNVDIDTDVKTALQFYTNAEYQKAITIFENNQNNIISKFYLGLSYIETNDFVKAKESFQAVLDHNDNLFIEQSEWYKALCLLKLNKNKEAAILFAEIENSNSLFRDQASKILKSIK